MYILVSYVLFKTDLSVFDDGVCALSLVGMTDADNQTYTEMFRDDGGTSKIPSVKNS